MSMGIFCKYPTILLCFKANFFLPYYSSSSSNKFTYQTKKMENFGKGKM